MAKSATKLKAAPEPEPKLKLDLGAGNNCREGFKSVDAYAKADYTADLFKFPWPFKDSSVEEAHCSHFFEHVPHLLRGKFMDELYRVLAPGGKARFITPYYMSPRATQDFTHEWPPVSEYTYQYFNKGWRENNKLTHGYYDLKCDFDYGYAFAMDVSWGSRNDEARGFAVRHYNNVVNDLDVTLTSRKGG